MRRRSRNTALSLSYLNLAHRFNYALQGYSQTQFFYGNLEGVFYDPAFSGIIDRDLSIATRTIRGATAFGIWPLNRYRRLELTGSFQRAKTSTIPPFRRIPSNAQIDNYGAPLFRSGTFIPFGVNFVQETTIFREFGPLSGSTVQPDTRSPKIGELLSRQTTDIDARYYVRLGARGYWRCAPAGSRAGAMLTSCTRRQLRDARV